MEIVKFGGSSFATAATIKLCGEIVKSSRNHKVIVVSAPGKYGTYTTKVTDDLIKVAQGENLLDEIMIRFDTTAHKLLSPTKYSIFQAELTQTAEAITRNPQDYNFIVSRGEYLAAKLFALYLDYNFIDAADILVINDDATVDLEATRQQIKKHKLKKCLPLVIGGFYGQKNGATALFSRGGSDYTGAILAALLSATLYKNYTDTNGIQTADPNIVYDTKTIPCLDFDSLDILTHNGAGIIHENVANLLKTYRVPLRVDNTFNPNQNYTEVHSLKCRNCQLNFFCVTHKGNKILMLSKKNGSPVAVQIINSTPETITQDLQKIHSDLSKSL